MSLYPATPGLCDAPVYHDLGQSTTPARKHLDDHLVEIGTLIVLMGLLVLVYIVSSRS